MSNRGALRDLEADTLWVCSDLHGHWDDYARVRTSFERVAGSDDALVFLGDLVHARSYGHADASLRIVNDLRLRPDRRITSLLGNHELMHIYHWHVSHGHRDDYVAKFEHAMGTDRAAVLQWMTDLPLALRWRNGLLHHTGASARVLRTDPIPTYPFVREWNHRELLGRICAQGGFDRDTVWSRFQPALGAYFGGTRTGRFVWDSWFSKNEQTWGDSTYHSLMEEMLDVYGSQHERLQWMVTGHIHAPAGYTLVGERQLRLCSSAGADAGQGRVLRLRARTRYGSAADLLPELMALAELP